jgi:hypothetical protein
VPWNSRKSIGTSARPSFECRFTPRIWTSSRSSMRATGMPDWMVTITASQAARTEGNGHTPPEMASGMPCSLSVISVTMPSVPSEPTKSRVRS